MADNKDASAFSLTHHFAGKKAVMKSLFDVLVLKLREELPFEYKIGKSYIGLQHQLVFAAIYIQTRKIIVEFVARKVFKHPRIRKVVESGRNRWAYFVDVTSVSDIDVQLVDWIKQAYE